QAAEDRPLLRDQQGGEGQSEDDPEELRLVADQHLQRDPRHGAPPSLVERSAAVSPSGPKGGPWPSAARVNRETWSVRKSRSSSAYRSGPSNRSLTGRANL